MCFDLPPEPESIVIAQDEESVYVSFRYYAPDPLFKALLKQAIGYGISRSLEESDLAMVEYRLEEDDGSDDEE